MLQNQKQPGCPPARDPTNEFTLQLHQYTLIMLSLQTNGTNNSEKKKTTTTTTTKTKILNKTGRPHLSVTSNYSGKKPHQLSPKKPKNKKGMRCGCVVKAGLQLCDLGCP